MSGLTVALIIVALVVMAVGFQQVANALRGRPLDSRRAGPLVQSSRRRRREHRSVELDELTELVTAALVAPSAARDKLQLLLDGWRRNPRTGPEPETGDGWLDRQLSQLEQDWGIDPPDP